MMLNFIKFVIRGVVGAIIDTSVLWILTTYFFNSYFTKYVLSPAISSEVGIVLTYIICYFWIWKQNVNNNKSDFLKRFLLYNLALLISIFLKIGFLDLINKLFNFHIIVCDILALCASGIFSFFASEKFIFVKRGKNNVKKNNGNYISRMSIYSGLK